MGRVWLAEHIHLERKVAVKVLPRDVRDSSEARERFLREARATAKIDSPHVVRVLDFDFSERGVPFLVLELLDGETLEDRIGREGPLSISAALGIFTQAADALSAAHAAGVIHRDIKAENIFLIGDVVKLIDFGIALDDRPEEGAGTPGAVGTPHYMSAEQLAAACDVDERSDLFSLGVCTYYSLTGRFPFEADTYTGLSLAIHTGVFTPPSWLRQDIPDALDAWFEKALARAPADRFESATAMRDALAAACARKTPITVEAPTRANGAARRGAIGFAFVLVVGAVALVAARAHVAASAAFDGGVDATLRP